VECGYTCESEGTPCETKCGDGLLTGNEACDDKNVIANDGCSGDCQVEHGWVCSYSDSESCPMFVQFVRCECAAGFTRKDKCVPCAAGKFKSVTGNDACTDCFAGTYSPTSGNLEETSCLSCNAGSYSRPGAALCINCPANSDSQIASADAKDCRCKKGFFASSLDSSCIACAVGKYKELTGPWACEDCDAGKYSNKSAASASDTCQTCPSNTESRVGSASLQDCICSAGFEKVSEVCLGCKAGFYKGIASTQTCSECTPGTFSSEGAKFCKDCPAGSFASDRGSSSCTACEVGKYSENVGDSKNQCSLCPNNTVSLPGSSSKLDCECKPGWTGPDAGPCERCGEGSFKDSWGSKMCTECLKGTFSSSLGGMSQETCLTCPANAISPTRSTKAEDCVCTLGYYGPPGGPCIPKCGDGLKVEEEGCDDSNLKSGDGCSGSCNIDCGFSCLLLQVDSPSKCTAECGDGLRKGFEQCDDGNLISGDGCSSECSVEKSYMCFTTETWGVQECGLPEVTCKSGVCGLGTRDPVFSAQTGFTKECDDGNTVSGDGCSNACSIECGWECTGGSANSRDICSQTACGDSKVAGSETCDDGNKDSFDGCSAECSKEIGWSCFHSDVPPFDCGIPDICNEICGDGIRAGRELEMEGGDGEGSGSGSGLAAGCDDGNEVQFKTLTLESKPLNLNLN
jgi:large repetitive protein